MIAVAVFVGACTPSIDVPPAPDLEPVLQAYARPTATVTSDIMEEVADLIAKAAEEIEDSKIVEELLEVITDVQQELESATAMTCQGGAMDGKTCKRDEDCQDGTCNGPTVLVVGGICNGGSNAGRECAADSQCPDGTCAGGVTLPNPTGAIQINYICPGWDEGQFDPDYLKTCKGGANDRSACTDDADCPDGTCIEARPDPANGAIDLFMTLDSGGIGRVVWGTANDCLYLLPKEGDDCEAMGCSQGSYDGSVAVDLGPDWVSEAISQLPITFVLEGNIRVDDDNYSINQSFRVDVGVESFLGILVDISDPALSQPPLSQTFNYIFAGEAQAIRDASGTFGCDLGRSFCFNLVCDAGTNAGSVCATNADCPEGECVEDPLFFW
jgi:hypothetical protein